MMFQHLRGVSTLKVSTPVVSIIHEVAIQVPVADTGGTSPPNGHHLPFFRSGKIFVRKHVGTQM